MPTGNSSGSGGGRSAASGSNADYSTNAPVITTGGNIGGYAVQPKTLLTAISEIQQFYVIESKGQDIPSEFLTIEGMIGFFKVGSSSGFSEGMFVFMLFPIFNFYLNPFILKTNDLTLKLLVGSIPFMSIIINGLLCIYVSRYYVGNLTRKAINSLFSGRSIVLVAKSFIIYIVYLFISRLSTPERIWMIAQHFGTNSEAVYTHYMQILPHIMPNAERCAVYILIAAIVPYGSVYLLDVLRTARIRRNRMRIMGKP